MSVPIPTGPILVITMPGDFKDAIADRSWAFGDHTDGSTSEGTGRRPVDLLLATTGTPGCRAPIPRSKGKRRLGAVSCRRRSIETKTAVATGAVVLRGYWDWDSLRTSGVRASGLELEGLAWFCIRKWVLHHIFRSRKHRFPTNSHGWNRGPKRRILESSWAPCTKPSLHNSPRPPYGPGPNLYPGPSPMAVSTF